MTPDPFETLPTTKGPRRTILIVGFAVVLTVAAIIAWRSSGERSPDTVIQEAHAAFSKGDFETARRLANQFLESSPDSTEALLISGQASLHLGRCTEGERSLRLVLAGDQNNGNAHNNLMRLLKMEGRLWELRPHALFLLRGGDPGDEFLIPLAAPDDMVFGRRESEMAEACRLAVPDDSAPLLGITRHLLQKAEFEKAKTILRKIVTDTPENIEAQSMLGTAIQQLDDSIAFLKWHRQLPKAAEEHPEIWYLRGVKARRDMQPRVAIRCFWEAIVRDPNHRRANYQLSQLLASVAKPKAAKEFAKRFERLEEVSRLATRGNDSSGSKLTGKTMYRIALVMEELGRLREAAGWFRKAIELNSYLPDVRQQLERVTGRINSSTPLTLLTSNPAKQIDLSSNPLPDWSTNSGERNPKSNPAINPSRVSFLDKAKLLGLSFRFHNGANAASGLARMYEFSGGGVAVLDYDGDYWPDLYFTQGSSWPLGLGEHQDRLFRNVNGKRFEDVTEQAGLGDERYSQGATIGDFNNDGFPDIYLANIGANRLYRNNGDGTFTDVGDSLKVVGDDWTVSCLLADVNGDSLPDIYCVNYLAGDDVFTRKCGHPGRPVQCPLNYFPSAQDRLYLNLGDGRFQDMTDTSGIAIPEGKGMGIVAGNFHPSSQLSLFIANDDKPNYFFEHNANSREKTISFSNHALRTGLAFGDTGSAQSCMGVAAGDMNNDGLLDLFVTNFTAEHSNLYLQLRNHTFEDSSRQAGLHLATLPTMGWGAQFLDADLDGLLDLLVANGHLDKSTAGNLPYKMRTQFFRNLGNNRFVESPSKQVGPYFEQRYAGRAVARIDWNRDSANDLCVTHVTSPVALLTNETSNRGHYLSLHLRGVHCSRDAIGAIVKIKADEKLWFRHLTAGDGFQASNERKLVFGFGGRTEIDELTIYWPSGLKQVVQSPKLDTELLIIEGMSPRILTK